MSTSGNSIINLGDLAKPVNTLVEKISDAIGGAVRPWQIKRVAKAEAEAETIKAIAQVQLPELQKRAIQRLLHEETQKQLNIDNVTAKALPSVAESATPEDIKSDWLVNFFDKSKLVSDDHMQEVWARILAGEANVPGSFSRFTINVLGNMEKEDADLFSKLCAASWMMVKLTPVVYDVGEKLFHDRGLHMMGLSHLERLGLINLNPAFGYRMTDFDEIERVSYGDRVFQLALPKGTKDLDLGKVVLSRVGDELSNVCSILPDYDYMNYVLDKWKSFGYSVSPVSA